MKKFIVIILILLSIFVGMYIYRKNKIEENRRHTISATEVNQIETYIQKIYMWREVTEQALPTFDDINDAPDLWVWEVVKKNIEDYELSYDQIENMAQQIFGENFKKEFPKEGYKYMQYDETSDKYIPVGTGLDNKEDVFLLNNIEKNDEEYTVQIIEYLEEYGGEDSANNVKIENLKDEVIENIASTEETNIQKIVKENIDKFTKKEIKIKKNNETSFNVISVKDV